MGHGTKGGARSGGGATRIGGYKAQVNAELTQIRKDYNARIRAITNDMRNRLMSDSEYDYLGRQIRRLRREKSEVVKATRDSAKRQIAFRW